MKKTKLLTLGLASVAIAGIVGAGVGLNNQMKVDEAKATDPTTLYLDTTYRKGSLTNESNWTTDSAKFAVWYWGAGNPGAWTSFMTDANADGIYEVSLPSCDYFILARLKAEVEEPAWGADNVNIHNQTQNILYNANYDLYAIVSWDGDGGKSGYMPGKFGSASLTLGGTPHPMTRESVEQYALKDLPVAIGDTFTFTVAGNSIEFTPSAGGNNNYTSDGIRFAGTIDVYLKWNGSAYSVYAGGMPELEGENVYLIVRGKSNNAMYVGLEEFSIQDLNLAKDDTILFQRMGKGDVYYWDDTYVPNAITEGLTSNFTLNTGTKTLTVDTAGYYDLYLTRTGNLKVFSSAQTDAYEFARDFNDKVGAECGKIEASEADNLVSIWATMKTAYLALTYEESRTALKNAVGNPASEDALQVFAAKYEQVYNKYLGSAKVLEDFMGKYPPSTSFNVTPATNDNTATIFFIALGAAGVVIGGCSYIALRKRKED